MYLSTFRHFGLTLRSRTPATMVPRGLLGNRFLEPLSARVFAADGIQRVLTFIDCFNKCRWVPCAHRSNGNRGHRALSNHARAEVLSSSRNVSLPAQNAVKVSQVINSAKNSASLILTLPSDKSTMTITFLQSVHAICQKRPWQPGNLLFGCPKCNTPAIP